VPISTKALREALLARVITDYATLAAEHCGEDPEMLAPLAEVEPPSDEELGDLPPDPDHGPPDAEDAWVLDLPGELLDEYFAALPSPPPGQDVLEAGFWHSNGGGGYGFASGGTSDAMAPGPVLAGLAERAWDGGLGQLDDDALVGVLCAARRLTSWGAALELAATADLANRRLAAEEAGQAGLAEHVDDEIAAALTLTGRGAGRLLDLALTLDRLPATMAALRAGEIDQPRAAVIADETALLGPTLRPAVEAHLLRRASEQTTSELRAAAKRAVIAVDPAAARKRKEKAQREARVERWEETAGTAALAGRDLPPAGVLAADKHLSGIARSLKDAGVEGTMDNLRALAYLTLLAGQPISSLLTAAPGTTASEAPGRDAADPDTAGRDAVGPDNAGPSTTAPDAVGNEASDADAPGSGPADRTAGAATSDAGAPGAGPADRVADTATSDAAAPGAGPADRAVGGGHAATGGTHTCGPDPAGFAVDGVARFRLPPLTGSVNLTMPLATWLGVSDAPGNAAGYGPLDAGDVRLLGSALAERADTPWCITLTDTEGQPVAHGCASPRPRKARPGRTRAGPGGHGSDGHGSDGHGSDGHGTHRSGTHRRGSDGGQPDGGGPAQAAPGVDGPARAGPGWDGTAWNFTIAPLPGDPCSHLHETAAYRASPGLRHLLEIRNATCTYIGCRRPADRCDLDHAVPYDRGGRTCACNLGPRCRRHHKAKQTPGWQLVQSQTGDLTWTTPSRRSYTTHPTQYLE
jgi:uncharacterized protein DUF222